MGSQRNQRSLPPARAAPIRAHHKVPQSHLLAPSSISPIQIRSRSEGSPIAKDHARLRTGLVISIDTLPDEAVLAIFDHYVHDVQSGEERQWAWLSLVHVCRRWRSIAFESPRRLNLRLVCRGGTPARDRLDVWPALPLIILVDVGDSIGCVDNIVAVLERSDRVCQINLVKPRSWDMEMILAAMQQPFPELTRLGLELERDGTMPVVPDSSLGPIPL